MKKKFVFISYLFHIISFVILTLSIVLLLTNIFWLLFEKEFFYISEITMPITSFLIIIAFFEMILKTIKESKFNKTYEIKYRIGFYPAVKYTPKVLIILLYFVWLIIPIGYVIGNNIGIQLALISVFDYFSAIVFLSSINGFKRYRDRGTGVLAP